MTSATALRAYNSMFLSDDNFIPSNASHASYGTALREFVESKELLESALVLRRNASTLCFLMKRA
jgi:hypothetical protein